MPQVTGRTLNSRPNVAPEADSVRQPTITAEQSVIRKADGSVYIVETTANGNISETRVDSQQDADLIARGQSPWWAQHVQDEVIEVEETPEVITTLDPRDASSVAVKTATATKAAATKANNKAGKKS